MLPRELTNRTFLLAPMRRVIWSGMVRNYQCKSNRFKWTKENLELAFAAVQEGMPVRQAAKMYRVPRTTLQRRLIGKAHSGQKGPIKPVFSNLEETEFAQHLIKLQTLMYGLSRLNVRRLAFEFAEKNGITHSFSVEKRIAGEGWLAGFLKRNRQLSVRTTQQTSMNRLTGFNRGQVKRFFDLLKGILEEYKLTPDCIYNVDETGISSVPTKAAKIVAKKGSRQVGFVASAEKGETTTVVCCFNASGTMYIPPAMIFKRKRMIEVLTKSAPEGTVAFPSDKGWMTENLFPLWLDHFIKHVKPTANQKVLLILDNHVSHCSIAAIEKARENNILMLSLPPHTSHKLQPLDRTFFYGLKNAYREQCQQFMLRNPGKRITQYDIAEIFGKSYKKNCTMEKAVSGFAVTGIWPYNPDVFTETDFEPAKVTERAVVQPSEPQIQLQSSISSTQSLDSHLQQQPSNSNLLSESSGPSIQPQPSGSHIEPQPSGSQHIEPQPSGSHIEPQPSGSHIEPQPSGSHIEPQPSESHIEHRLSGSHIEHQPSGSYIEPRPSTSSVKSSSPVSWKDLSPLPKTDGTITGRKRKSQTASIITSSPFKAAKLELSKKKLEKITIHGNRKKKATIKAQKDGIMGLQKRKGNITGSDNETVERKMSGKGKGTNKGKGKLIKGSATAGNCTVDANYFCLFCEEKYVHPPCEEWIQCMKCMKWCHEKCANYEGGGYICDFCQ